MGGGEERAGGDGREVGGGLRRVTHPEDAVGLGW